MRFRIPLELFVFSLCLLNGFVLNTEYVFCQSANGKAAAAGPFLASGIKVGEVDSSSATIWVRLTAEREARFAMNSMFTEGVDPKAKDRNGIPMPENVVPGQIGQFRVTYWNAKQFEQPQRTDWIAVRSDQDFCDQVTLEGLGASTRYQFTVEVAKSPNQGGSAAKEDPQPHYSEQGSFRTAPAAGSASKIQFVVTTCQAIRSIDSGTDGHRAYLQMLKLQPDFFVHTGDIVYYDKVPLCKNEAQARAKWGLMFSYGHKRAFHRNVPSYFMKDDHDTLKNDCWPGQTYGDLTFKQGLSIFREQTPMREKTYRTYRWGRDVQIWLTENRDYRSSNRMPDGPDKSILGAEQKAWLKRTLKESDATFKFVISPGPLVGPDKKGKSDNHANAAFDHEGQELREFVAQLGNAYVICGDRHWQYCSQDPETGLLEMGCGPVNDEHDFGGDPGYDKSFHRYFGARGGFLGVTVDGDQATAEWFSANDPLRADGRPKVLHTEVLPLSN
ncbi:MAG: alkaline phosphatase [Pirellulaceae bacterium]